MSARKGTSPGTIVGLAVAACGALGFAYWNVTRAMNQEPPPPPTAGTPGTVAGSPQPATPGAVPGTPAATVAAVQIRPAASEDADLAPGADPFLPLPMAPAASPAAILASTRLPRGGGASPVLPALMGWAPPTPLPAQGPPHIPRGAAPPRAALPARPREPAPELVGTLLGDNPCAVFVKDKQTVVVPVGGKFGAWQVVVVEHSSVVLRQAGQSLRLSVGGTASGGTAPGPPPGITPAGRVVPADAGPPTTHTEGPGAPPLAPGSTGSGGTTAAGTAPPAPPANTPPAPEMDPAALLNPARRAAGGNGPHGCVRRIARRDGQDAAALALALSGSPQPTPVALGYEIAPAGPHGLEALWVCVERLETLIEGWRVALAALFHLGA